MIVMINLNPNLNAQCSMPNAQRSIGWFKHTEYSDSEGTKLTVNRNGYENRTAADDDLEELNVNFVNSENVLRHRASACIAHKIQYNA